MQHKWMVLLTTFILFSLLIAPAGTTSAHARTEMQDIPPNCPPYRAGLLREDELLESLPLECIRAYKEAARLANLPKAETTADAEANTVGDPDKFGYTYGSVPYNPISATTNTGLTGDDVFTGPINIGFSFPFYGTPQTQLYINTNGLITFGAGSRKWGGVSIPNDVNPNNFIAAFWDDLVVGAPYNSGGIYYSRGGSAPNRYFVVEWRDIENLYDSFASFEAILYENGDIALHHGSIPRPIYNTVGLEDSSGHQGLYYKGGDCCWSDTTAVRFYYPTTPRARVLAYSLEPSGFAPLNGHKDFTIVVKNTGTLGTDTYDVTESTATWPVTYYAANGITPLSDTDADGKKDTGPLAQGASTNIIARFTVPAGAVVGEISGDFIEVTSSLNNSMRAYVPLRAVIPAPFASVFVNDSDGAMSFLTASADRTDLYKATGNNYFGSDVVMAQLTSGNYFYAWSKGSLAGGKWTGNIEYAALNGVGTPVRAAGKLTDNASAALYTWDDSPSVAVAPNGTVGVVWRRYIYDNATGRENYNIFFVTLNAAGARLTGPTNITNNGSWSDGTYGLDSLTIAASTDNRFVIGWEVYAGWQHDIWFAVHNTNGVQVVAPKALTSNHHNAEPILNTLAGGKVIITWSGVWNGPFYTVLTSTGAISKPTTTLNASDFDARSDAVQLPNGKVAIAWANHGEVQLRILNSSYDLENQGYASIVEYETNGHSLSVTTDASSRIIMTWMDGDGYNKQFYALGHSNGFIFNDPFVYNVSRDGMNISWNGQGNAPYLPDPVISGNAGVAGATLNYTGDSATTDGIGRYSFKVPRGWSGTVTPSKSGYIFTPLNRTYSNIAANQTGQNYTAVPLYSISGNVGVAGVTLSYTYGTPKTVVSQANGNYSFTVPANWSGTVTPAHACFTFDPVDRSYSNLGSNQTAQDHTPTAIPGCADVSLSIGGAGQGRYGIPSPGSTRASFAGLDKGPVKIESTNVVPILGAERLIYKVNGVATSFSEMMALPDSQLDTIYWLPWYNNKDLNTQLRFANVSATDATVHVTIGGVPMTGSPFTLAPGASTRKSYAGIDKGPVKIESDVDIVAAERVIYNVNSVDTSFSEMMALPDKQLDMIYWLPWYNNKDLDTQLRIANVSATEATVHVTISGVPMTGSPYTLAPGASRRLSYVGIDKGPVKIESDVNIVAAERLIYKVNNIATSFSEMMALPNSQLDTMYWLPWYNNRDLDTQLRIANVSATEATVHVTIGGVEMTGSAFTLAPGASRRLSFPGIDKGPVKIESNVNIVAAERVIYKVNNIATSFSEMMALPNSLLDTIYWLPWYNNVDLDTQLRFGVP